MNYLLNNLKFDSKTFLILLITFFPLTLLIGSSFINSTVVLIKEKKLNFFNNQTFYILVFLWFTLIINMILSIDIDNSLTRAFGFIRFIIFVFAIKFILNKNENDDKFIFIAWFLIFGIVTIDIVFESIFGFNTLGFKNNFPGRISSFLNDELKIGNFYYGFILFALSFIYYNTKNKKNFFVFLIFFTFVSFLIGERSNFLKIFTIIFFLYLLVDKTVLWKKLATILVFFILITLFISQNNNYKDRFINQTFSFFISRFKFFVGIFYPIYQLIILIKLVEMFFPKDFLKLFFT